MNIQYEVSECIFFEDNNEDRTLHIPFVKFPLVDCLDLYFSLSSGSETASFEGVGFSTTLDKLSNAGWKAKYDYTRWALKKHSIIFLHPISHLTFRIKVSSLKEIHGTHYIEIRPSKFAKHELVERDFTEKDIPHLLDIVVKLQKNKRKKQIQETKLPEAELFNFFRI